MRFRFRTCLAVSLFIFSQSASSVVLLQDSATGASNDEAITKVKEYLENLGKYFGYDLTNYCGTDGPCGDKGQAAAGGQAAGQTATGQPAAGGEAGSTFSRQLLNEKYTQSTQLDSYSGYLGILLGGKANPLLPGQAEMPVVQNFSGQTFPSYQNEQGGNAAGGEQKAAVTVSPTVDQKEFQADPVSQSILNMLSTPDNSYCYERPDSDICKALSRQAVVTNPWVKKEGQGTTSNASTSLVPNAEFPKPEEAFLPATNQPLIPELNSNTFLMPLLYSSESSEGKASQAQQAANFVRNVAGLFIPIATASFQEYAQQFKDASEINPSDTATEAAERKNKAQTILGDYLLRIRMYAAQSSVALGNLYYMLSRRLPQGDGKTSAALAEFKMASWRLFDFKASPNPQDPSEGQKWLAKIQQGSAASVQKEIAVLLAEINYQLYLQRQQNERLLLAQSIAMLQLSRFSSPGPRLNQPQLLP